MREFIKRLRAQLDELLVQRAAVVATRDGIIAAAEAEARSDLNADETAKVTEARASLADIDTRKAALEARIAELEAEANADDAAAELRTSLGLTTATPAHVTSEPRTYSAETSKRDGVSFFADAFRSQFMGDASSATRLARHQREVEVEREMRATTTSSFAGLIVPQYLVDLAALVLRNGRPTANACTRLDLPEQGTTFQVPRGTTGAATAIQNPENTAVQNTDEVWANVTVNVATIAGQQDVSRQSIERGTPGLDQLVYLDLAGAYAANLDSQVLNGSGASGQMLGMLQTSGINAATAFGAAPTAANFTSKLAGQVGAVAGAGTAIQPRVVIMHPRRWAWLQSLSDSTGRPLAVALPVGAFNAGALITKPGGYSADGAATGEGGPQFVGILANGLPVITDANVPTNVGAATGGEDIVIVLDTMQSILWEDGDGAPRQLRFEQTLGNQLTVKLVVYGYAAFTAGRYPASVGKIGGLDTTTNGLVAPVF